MDTKVCFRCGEEKLLEEFYVHPQMKDGHLNKCKTCTRGDSKLMDKKIRSTKEGIENERERHRLKYHRLNYKVKHKPTYERKKNDMDKYRSKYPEKTRAKDRSQHMIKKEKCNHLHHWSYNKEHYRDVIELSIEDHFLLHRNIIYDQERFMYRDCRTGILLDTKESHIEKLKSLKIHE